MIEPILQNIGLNEKESRVFLATLELGEQPASEIAKQVRMPRNTARFILDRLAEKGLVKITLKANTQRYAAEEPQNLVYTLEKKRVNETAAIDQKISALKEVMAELKTHFGPDSTKPRVTFYEGKEGVISLYEDTLKSSETIRSLGCYDVMTSVFSEYFKSHHARRLKKKIHVRRIHPDTPQGIAKAKLDKKELRESRLIPHGSYYFTPEILAYDNHLLMISWKELLGIHIESEEITEAFKVIFELAWNEATRLDTRYKKTKV